MSKPPFLISNRAGTELWPRTGQTPTAYRTRTTGEGLSAEEIARANELVLRYVEDNAGRIKQYFLRQRMASDLGIVQFVSNMTKITEGVYVRYIRNAGQEQLIVDANANVVLVNPEIVKPKPVQPIETVLITFDWSLADGKDLDIVGYFTVPGVSQPTGWFVGTSSGIYSPGMAFDPGPFQVLPPPTSEFVNNPSDGIIRLDDGTTKVAYWTYDNTDDGPERIVLDLRPLYERGYKAGAFEFFGQWYDERNGGSANVTVDCYVNSDEDLSFVGNPASYDLSQLGTKIVTFTDRVNVRPMYPFVTDDNHTITQFEEHTMYTVDQMGVFRFADTGVSVEWGGPTNINLRALMGFTGYLPAP